MSDEIKYVSDLHFIDIPQYRVPDNVNIIGSINHNPVYKSPDGALIYKPETTVSIKNAQVLRKYTQDLLNGGVCFPPILRGDLQNGHGKYYAMLTLPHFHSYNTIEHFGGFEVHDTPRVLGAYLEAMKHIGKTIPTSEFAASSLDEEREDLVWDMLSSYKGLIEDDYTRGELCGLYEQIAASQTKIQNIPREVAHKDANHSNWRPIEVGGKIFIQFIDIDTLGLARPGWDEGRGYAMLALDEEKQDIFLKLLSQDKRFENPDVRLYFWRVVLLRCLRETVFLNKGKYDTDILTLSAGVEDQALNLKHLIKSALKKTLYQSSAELDNLLL